MTCNVILTTENGRFLAHVAELPDCKAEAESRAQVLALIQKRLEEISNRIEVVQLKIPQLENRLLFSGKQNKQLQIKEKAATPPSLVHVDPPIAANDKSVHLETPWEYFGIFKDDPTWLPMLEDIERRRNRHVVYPKKRKTRKGKK
jgi:predicted RNase H-like HicB family nuclease